MSRRKTFSGGEQEANEFIKSIAEAHDGQRATILALQSQVALAIRIGMPRALGITDKEFAERCYETQGGTIQLSIEKRREVVGRLTAPVDEGGEGLSTREAAAVLGVHQTTVARDRQSDADASDSQSKADANASVVEDDDGTPESLGCAECGTPTLPRWVTPEEEFTGRLLCGRCAEQANSVRVVEPDASDVDLKEEPTEPPDHAAAEATQVWQTLLKLSGCREFQLEHVIAGLPVDRLEHVEPVANALIDWLGDLMSGVRDRQSRQPVGLFTERIKRGKEHVWRNPA